MQEDVKREAATQRTSWGWRSKSARFGAELLCFLQSGISGHIQKGICEHQS